MVTKSGLARVFVQGIGRVFRSPPPLFGSSLQPMPKSQAHANAVAAVERSRADA